MSDLNPNFDQIILVTLISFCYSLFLSVMNKKLIYTPEYIQQAKLASKLRMELMEARRKKDEVLIKKLQKKYELLMKSTMKVYVKIFMMFIFTFGLFILLLNLMDPVFGSTGTNFMTLPFPIPPFLGKNINYFAWFIISSFFFSTIFHKLLKFRF